MSDLIGSIAALILMVGLVFICIITAIKICFDDKEIKCVTVKGCYAEYHSFIYVKHFNKKTSNKKIINYCYIELKEIFLKFEITDIDIEVKEKNYAKKEGIIL